MFSHRNDPKSCSIVALTVFTLLYNLHQFPLPRVMFTLQSENYHLYFNVFVKVSVFLGQCKFINVFLPHFFFFVCRV